MINETTMYEIELENLDMPEIRKARKWCRQNFGEIPIRKFTKVYDRNGKQGGVHVMRYYDQQSARWFHQMKKANYFYFRNQSDAAAFKLRWFWDGKTNV